jgi:hypothetical protein
MAIASAKQIAPQYFPEKTEIKDMNKENKKRKL